MHFPPRNGAFSARARRQAWLRTAGAVVWPAFPGEAGRANHVLRQPRHPARCLKSEVRRPKSLLLLSNSVRARWARSARGDSALLPLPPPVPFARANSALGRAAPRRRSRQAPAGPTHASGRIFFIFPREIAIHHAEVRAQNVRFAGPGHRTRSMGACPVGVSPMSIAGACPVGVSPVSRGTILLRRPAYRRSRGTSFAGPRRPRAAKHLRPPARRADATQGAEAIHAGLFQREVTLPEQTERETWDPAKDKSDLGCLHCGCKHLRTVYMRSSWGGRLVRRRQCRHCGRRFTTWETLKQATQQD
jgi:hypothetical protein